MNTRGQFFLVAAVLIIGIVIGLSSAVNSVKTYGEEEYVYDLGEEIKFETNEVLNNGVYNQGDENYLIEQTKQFLTENYGNSIGFDEVLFVYGNKNELQGLFFEEVSAGSIGISTGPIPANFNIRVRTQTTADVQPHDENDSPGYERVSVRINDITYDFNLRDGQNFFLVIRKVQDEQRTVATR